MSDVFTGLIHELTDEEHDLLYGRTVGLEPHEAAELLRGLDIVWWIIGGWAIEAFTGASRPHHDLDVAVQAPDVGALVGHLLPRFDVWAAGSGMLKPYLAAHQPVPDWSGQIWIREDASSPWLLDFNIAPIEDGRWVFKRDRSVTLELEDTMWTGPDGLRYQRPEIVLAFKALGARPQDDADFEATIPLLESGAVAWLEDTIRRLCPDHRWLELISRANQ